MIKRILLSLLCTSVIFAAEPPVQKSTGFGWRPLQGWQPFENIGFKAETKETIDDLTKTIAKTAKTVTNGMQESTVHLTQALNLTTQDLCGTLNKTTKKLTDTADKLIDKGLTINLDPALNANIKTVAEQGVKINVDPALNANIQRLANNGIRTQFAIDPTTIKTLCFSTTGAALAMAGIGLILYESFFVEDYATETPKPTTWHATVKNFMKNRYILGTASIAAGLCLIAKSTTL